MPVRIQKPAVNIREKLAELERPIGVNGAALMATNTPQDAFSLIGAGRRNRIINGDMRIDQRNAGAAITGITGGGSYAVDRFFTYNQSSGNYTAQQISDAPPGFKNSLRVTVATAASSATAAWTSFILQYIEGFNVADLNGGTSAPSAVTLSFWVKSSITGIMPLCINNGATRQYNTTYTINTANTWEKKFITLTLDTAGTWNSTNGRGLGIAWGLGSGSSFTNSSLSTLNTWQAESPLPNFYYSTSNSVQFGTNLNATFQLTGVQLEEGKVATPFEFRSYSQELELCQRYYEKSFEDTTAPTNGSTSTSFSTEVGLTWGWASHRGTYPLNNYPGRSVFARFKVSKRTAPSVAIYGNSGGYPYLYDSTNGGRWVTTAWGTASSKEGWEHQNEFSSNNPIIFAFCHWAASAEL
jgi:hypothetical protein